MSGRNRVLGFQGVHKGGDGVQVAPLLVVSQLYVLDGCTDLMTDGLGKVQIFVRKTVTIFPVAEVDQAEGWLRRGMPLAVQMLPGLRLPVALFVRGGLATLEAIRRQDYDVWTRRPTVSRWEKVRLLFGRWWDSNRKWRSSFT